MVKLGYDSDRLVFGDAINLLDSRGYDNTQLVTALRDGRIKASGFIKKARKNIPPSWWDHYDTHDGDLCWFKPLSEKPKMPGRVNDVYVLKSKFDRIWPEESLQLPQTPEKPKATMPVLLVWASMEWPEGNLPPRDSLLTAARGKFSDVKEYQIRTLRRKLASAESKKGGAPQHRNRR